MSEFQLFQRKKNTKKNTELGQTQERINTTKKEITKIYLSCILNKHLNFLNAQMLNIKKKRGFEHTIMNYDLHAQLVCLEPPQFSAYRGWGVSCHTRYLKISIEVLIIRFV